MPGPQHHPDWSVGVARTGGHSGRQHPLKPYNRTDVHQRIRVSTARNAGTTITASRATWIASPTRPSSSAMYPSTVRSVALAVAFRQPPMAPRLTASDRSSSNFKEVSSMTRSFAIASPYATNKSGLACQAMSNVVVSTVWSITVSASPLVDGLVSVYSPAVPPSAT
jgi:hypothetical protein